MYSQELTGDIGDAVEDVVWSEMLKVPAEEEVNKGSHFPSSHNFRANFSGILYYIKNRLIV